MPHALGSLLRAARANQRVEDNLTVRLDEARVVRKELWVAFFDALDSEDTSDLRHKLYTWELSDNIVKALEATMGLYPDHHKIFATYLRLIEAGYKE